MHCPKQATCRQGGRHEGRTRPLQLAPAGPAEFSRPAPAAPRGSPAQAADERPQCTKGQPLGARSNSPTKYGGIRHRHHGLL